MQEVLEAILRQLHQNGQDVKEIVRLISRQNGTIPAYHDELAPMEDAFVIDENDTELGTRDVLRILEISNSTLSRWRSQGVVQFRYLSSNHVAYLYSKLYNAVKSGKATCKGFSKIKALQRLDDYMSNLEALRDEDAHFQPQRL